MTDKDLEEIEEIFNRSIGVFAKIFQHKLDLVIECQKMLVEKMDGVEERLGEKIDAVAHEHISPSSRYRDSQKLQSF
ncbi:MAG: hypothetical protein NTV89_07800 [Proteobacteria bacterium]|nr:hypothetical protein [Pseudomonadota bacterium]